MSMNTEDYLRRIDDILDAAWAMPLSGGKVVVDVEQIRSLLDSVRAAMPSEVKQAKNIVRDRTDIIDTAKREAETIIRNAEERRNQILSHEEIVRQAQEKASELLTVTQKKARDMKKNAQEYTESLLRRAEEVLAQQTAELRQTRASLRGSQTNASAKPEPDNNG